jgi:hypothetical protein
MRRSALERGGKEANNWWRITHGLDGEGRETAMVLRTPVSNCNDLTAQLVVKREGKWRECVREEKGVEGGFVGLWAGSLAGLALPWAGPVGCLPPFFV